MQVHAEKQPQALSGTRMPVKGGFKINDRRPETTALNRLQALADAGPQVTQARAMQAKADARPSVAVAAGYGAMQTPQVQLKAMEHEEPWQGQFTPIQRQGGEEGVQMKGAGTLDVGSQQQAEAAPRPNNTGLPDKLKAGIESLSGISLDNVRVHYNSGKPAQLNAYAYAQGMDIHVAPGQERHLPHEAWHVVQQAQGRVQPTMQTNSIALNDDSILEKEAEVMGQKSAQLIKVTQCVPTQPNIKLSSRSTIQKAKYTWNGNKWEHDGGGASSNAPSPKEKGDFVGQVFDDTTGEYTTINNGIEQEIDIGQLRSEMLKYFAEKYVIRYIYKDKSHSSQNVNMAIDCLFKEMSDSDVGARDVKAVKELQECFLSYYESKAIQSFFEADVTDDEEIIVFYEGYLGLKEYLSWLLNTEGDNISQEEIKVYDKAMSGYAKNLRSHVANSCGWKYGDKLTANELKGGNVTKRVGQMIFDIYNKYNYEFDENHPDYLKIIEGLARMAAEVLGYIGENLKENDNEFVNLRSEGVIAALQNIMTPNAMGVHCHVILLVKLLSKFPYQYK